MCCESHTKVPSRARRSVLMELQVLALVLLRRRENSLMPTTIMLLLAAAPVLTLSMLHGNAWSPDALLAGQLALAAAVITVILWVVLDALQNLTHKWSRFTSRPY